MSSRSPLSIMPLLDLIELSKQKCELSIKQKTALCKNEMCELCKQKQDAWGELFFRFDCKMRTLIELKDGDEVVSRSWFQILRNLDNFNIPPYAKEPEGPFISWILTIAQNEKRQYLREKYTQKRDQTREVPIDVGDGTVSNSLSSHTPSPEDSYEQGCLEAAVVHALGQLDKVDREILILSYFATKEAATEMVEVYADGEYTQQEVRSVKSFTLKEIAEELDLGINEVRNRKKKARKKLKSLLEGEAIPK